ncbi:MAG: Gfo/Idh/MocA family protein [Gaiellaceae bacterium]
MADVRLGLIGCGLLAERGYVPAAQRAQGVRLAAVADTVAERCATAAPGVPAFSSAAELLAAGAADALVLATPASTHVADARRAAAAGVAALIEKPPAPSAIEAEALMALSPAPYIGFNRRFEPALRELRDKAARAGQVRLQLLLHRRRASWPSYESADPVALDLGPHLVDLAFWLTGGEAARVRGQAGVDKLELEIELADGRGTAHVECALGPRYRERVDVGGVGSFRRGGLRSALAARRESPLVASLALQLESFARAARGDCVDADLATCADGVRVMRALECVTS